ncbi:MAG: 5,10-methylenetetrahydromethanopterin reductase [Candidatus Methanofastidiosia archaeon]
MKFGIEFSPEKPTYDVAFHSKFAEDSRFHHVWITDHYNNRNVYVTMAEISRVTNEIMIGSAVTNPYVCHPVWTAEAIFTVDEISGGRAIFGIGAGDKMTLEALGIKWEKPLTAVKESVTIFKELNLKGKTKFQGELFKVKKAKVKKAPKHEIPIYIGAQGPKMLQMAAQLADGVLINSSHPKDFEPAVENVKLGVQKVKRKIDEIDVAAYTSFSIHKKRERAIKKARIVAGAIAAGSPDFILKRHGIEKEVQEEIKELFANQRFKEMKEGGVPDYVVDAFSIAGNPEDCVEKISELSKVGVSQIVMGMPLGKSKVDAMKLIKKEIIPHF